MFDIQGIEDERDFYISFSDAVAKVLALDTRLEISGFGDFKHPKLLLLSGQSVPALDGGPASNAANPGRD